MAGDLESRSPIKLPQDSPGDEESVVHSGSVDGSCGKSSAILDRTVILSG